MVACAAPQEGDNADDQTSDVTGGSDAVESSAVVLYDSMDRAATAKCMGALIGEKVAITAKSCAKKGMVLQRANKDSDRVKIKAVRAPDGESDIAIVELDKAIEGTTAVITHMPLRAGYSVNGIAAAKSNGVLGFGGIDKGEPSAVTGSILDEAGKNASITPDWGTKICDGDLGAPVCSSTEMKIPYLNKRIMGTCGLSGIVIGRTDAAAAPPAAMGDATPTAGQTGSCSNKPWKVAQIGQHADFIKRYAPKAFEPMKIHRYRLVPEGLWGYQTKGTVSRCNIETATLADVAPGAKSAKITAKVSFKDMDKRSAAWGRFGIAPKADATKMLWLPALKIGTAGGKQFDASFEGVVGAEKEGDYLVAFRASGNGGETWTQCDVDGGEFSAEKAVPLKVGNGTPPAQPGETSPQETPAPPSGDTGDTGYSDSTSSEETSTPSEEAPPGEEETKKADSSDKSGCSVSTNANGGLSALPVLGLLLGLAAVVRRRRRAS